MGGGVVRLGVFLADPAKMSSLPSCGDFAVGAAGVGSDFCWYGVVVSCVVGPAHVGGLDRGSPAE